MVGNKLDPILMVFGAQNSKREKFNRFNRITSSFLGFFKIDLSEPGNENSKLTNENNNKVYYSIFHSPEVEWTPAGTGDV